MSGLGRVAPMSVRRRLAPTSMPERLTPTFALQSGADVRAAKADADVRAARNVATPTVGWGGADLGAPATFVLLRHGETPLTPQKRFSGRGGSDPSLSDVGREQAERVAAALARRGTIETVLASPSPAPARPPQSSPPVWASTSPSRTG